MLQSQPTGQQQQILNSTVVNFENDTVSASAGFHQGKRNETAKQQNSPNTQHYYDEETITISKKGKGHNAITTLIVIILTNA